MVDLYNAIFVIFTQEIGGVLTQAEAQTLIEMQKIFANGGVTSISAGTGQTYELIGSDPRERFFLDIW